MNLYRILRLVLPLGLACLISGPLMGQAISSSAARQIQELTNFKAGRKANGRKISNRLLLAQMKAQGRRLASLSANDLPGLPTESNGLVTVDIRAQQLDSVLARLQALGGNTLYASHHSIRAQMPLASVEALQSVSDVQWVRPAARAKTNLVPALSGSGSLVPTLHALLHGPRVTPFIGSLTSQGYVAHGARNVVSQGVDGRGVKVGVLSDSALPNRVAALIASGDLPADTVVLPGQAGASDGTDEGAAMMEIIHDLAPGAQIFFASAFQSEQAFADNIRALRFQYGCDIIVDDVTYFDEGVFQDSLIASAVNDVTQAGALYFSSAANSGNLSSGTSSTWEADYRDGGLLPPANGLEQNSGASIHNFGTDAQPILWDTLEASTQVVSLTWSDPLGGSANDYDLFVLDRTGAQVLGASIDSQVGTQDPIELVYSDTGFPAGSRVVVVKYSGEGRALHLSANGSPLLLSTTGATFGHNAGRSTVSMAATAWNSAHRGTQLFTGFANPVETFSSDGPRKVFFNPDGTSITPGNYLFATEGGETLQKPDLTGADGVSTRTPGFNPFFGTSAAAPHAAAVAALVKSANPSLTNQQIREILTRTALDTMAPGVDRDSGFGIAAAIPAVAAAQQF